MGGPATTQCSLQGVSSNVARFSLYGRQFGTPSINQFPQRMLGGSPVTYIEHKFSERLRTTLLPIIPESSIELHPEPVPLQSRWSSDRFLPTFLMPENRQTALHIYDLYGNSAMLNVMLMLGLLGACPERLTVHQSAFNFPDIFYKHLALPQGQAFNALTIAPYSMIDNVIEQYSRAQMPLYRSKFADHLESQLAAKRNSQEIRKQVEEAKRRGAQLIEQMREAVLAGTPSSEICGMLIAGRIIQRADEHEDPVRCYERNFLKMIKNTLALKYNGRTYGFRYQDQIFLNLDLFYGELSAMAAELMISKHRVQQVNFFGSGGGLSRDAVQGKIFAPRVFSGPDRGGRNVEFTMQNSAFGLIGASDFSPVHLNVPSVLCETTEVLSHLSSFGSTVDCEAFYLAMLKLTHPEVDFKIAMRITDNALCGFELSYSKSVDFSPIARTFGLPWNSN